MTSPNVQQNQLPNQPELKDLLDLLKKDIFLNLNCHAIATVQSFDAANQTANVTINYKKVYFEPNVLTGGYTQKLVDYPILTDCPVIALGGGNGALTFPIATGDECIVFFNDRDMDNWFNGSSSSPIATPRKHSFADAVILVGVRSLATKLVSYNGTDIELRTKDGNVKIAINGEGEYIKASMGEDVSLEITADYIKGIVGAGMSFEVSSDGKVKFTNAGGELIAALSQLFTDIQNGLVSTALGPQQLQMPTFPTDLAILDGFKA